MYRVLYHCPNHDGFSGLREALPAGIHLEWQFDRSRLDEALARTSPHVLVLSLPRPSTDDLSRLKRIMEKPSAPAVVVTARQITLSQAVGCMREGVVDCLREPVPPEILASCLSRMAAAVPTDGNRGTTGKLITGTSPLIRNLLQRIGQYAPLPHPILIRGETGSGKDIAARTIHASSSRSDGPFVAINCAAVPESLWESELFGSSRGAFTGSVDRPGCFEQAHGGTLFLDEIGELNLHGQASLLRVIEDGKITRLGSFRNRKVDIRVVAATNRNLRECMKNQLFRPDLFYRLNLLSLHLPPLRKRKQDIPELTRTFLAQASPGNYWKISGGAMARLVRYSWPGNVRELQSVLLRASLLSKNGTIRTNAIVFD